MTSCAPLGVDLGPYAGVELLCTFFTMALWGVTCMQSFLYFFNNPTDSKYIKFLVVWLWIMDTVHQCLLISGSYKANVSGQIYLIDNVRAEYVIVLLFTSLVSVPTQTFFGYRIWRFADKNWIIPVLLAPAILFQLAEGIILIDLNLSATVGTEMTASTRQAILISNFAVGAAVDILLSAGLCFLLWRSYMIDGSSITQTNSMLHRLILFSINTGSWTALVAIATITMVVVFPGNFIYVGFYFVLSPIYCNSLLANLNARSYLRGAEKTRAIQLSGLSAAPHVQPSPS
ncbi:hypothetical protein BD779DRAFT_767150 [Infundibulicybe gibba]|nr:hypothetical protein BD779DRAFT_767150 [Infundibulicybe gibba]